MNFFKKLFSKPWYHGKRFSCSFTYVLKHKLMDIEIGAPEHKHATVVCKIVGERTNGYDVKWIDVLNGEGIEDRELLLTKTPKYVTFKDFADFKEL